MDAQNYLDITVYLLVSSLVLELSVPGAARTPSMEKSSSGTRATRTIQTRQIAAGSTSVSCSATDVYRLRPQPRRRFPRSKET